MQCCAGWAAVLTTVGLGAGCVRYVENTGPEGVVETRSGSVLFDRIGNIDTVRVSFVVYNRTGVEVALTQCPDRLALLVERQEGSAWIAVPELRCDGPQTERVVRLADQVFFPGTVRIADDGFYRMRAVLAAGNPATVEAPPSTVFEVR